MRPISEKNGFIDVVNGTSQDFNKLLRTVSRDIVKAFNIVNDTEKDIDKLNDALIQENISLKKKLLELKDDMLSVEDSLLETKNQTSLYKKYINISNGSNLMSNDAYMNTDYNMVTLPYTDSQKASMALYPRDFLNKNIDIFIEWEGYNGSDTLVQSGKITDEGDFLNIIDGTDYQLFMRRVRTNTEVTRVVYKVKINMPQKILTSLFINGIGIKPHPVYNLDLIDIKYTDADTKIVKDLPSFIDDTKQLTQRLSNIDNVKFLFPSIKAQALELVLEQKNFLDYGAHREWLIGFKNIDIENMKLTSESASFIMELSPHDTSRYFESISKPEVISAIPGINMDDCCKFELLYNPTDIIAFDFDSYIPSNKNQLFIKCTITNSNVFPALKGFDISYRLK